MEPLEIKNEVGLPSELILLIVSFGDPQTLARCARLSFDLLKFVSPFLYRKVTLRHAEDYGQLFCDRDPTTSQPRLLPFLSLDQIEHLHFHIDSYSPSLMFTDRISSSPLRLKSLELTYHDPSPRGRHHDIYSQLLPSTLICSRPTSTRLDPKNPLTAGNLQTAIKVGPHCMSAMVRAWKNVPTLVLAGAIPTLGRPGGGDLQCVFEAVNDDRQPPNGMLVVLDITNMHREVDELYQSSFALGLMMYGSPVGGTAWRVVVKVRTEEEASRIREGVGKLAAERVEVIVMERARVPMEDED